MKDKFFINNRISIDKWGWQKEGEFIAMVLRKHPQTYINFDSGKLMGMFCEIKRLREELNYEKTREIICKNCGSIVC